MQTLNIYEINTATWLDSLSRKYKRTINLANIPKAEWDILKSYSCNAVWLMGIWQRSSAAIEINRQDATFAPEMQYVLNDFNFDNDVIGSAYSIREYSINAHFGDTAALANVRHELNIRGMKLLLDFVPNHVAPDHAWAKDHPEYFVRIDNEAQPEKPENFIKIGTNTYALGRDPNGLPWSDVLQLNAFSPDLRQEAQKLLLRIAEQCDGVRCDMAMLVANDIFKQTWGSLVVDTPQAEYWQDVIHSVKSMYPDFIFIAEAYWDTQDMLIDQGFDYCYNKDFYDCARDSNNDGLISIFGQPISKLERQVLFLENHDEPRAASMLDYKKHSAAAVMLACLPSAHMFYEGQFIGESVRTPVQLGRAPAPIANEQIKQFYKRLLSFFAITQGRQVEWQKYQVNSKDDTGEVSTIISCGWKLNQTHYILFVNYTANDADAWIENPLNAEHKNELIMTIVFSTSGNKHEIEYSSDALSCRMQPYDAIIISLR